MSQLKILVKNNLRTLFRSRTTAIAVIAIPLLLLFLAGLAFDTTSIYRVRIGVYSDTYHELSNSVITTLEDSQFQVERLESDSACIDSVRLGDTHACIIFPAAFQLGPPNNELKFYIDPSRANLVGTVIETIEPKIAEQSTDISKELSTAIVDALRKIQSEIAARRNVITTITTNLNNGGQELGQVVGALGAPQTSFDLNTLGYQDVHTQSLAIEEQALALSDATINISISTKNLLVSARDEVNGSSLDSTTKAAIIEDINSALSISDSLIEAANESKNATESANLTGHLNNLLTQLTVTKTGVDQLNEFRDASVVTLGSVRQKLDIVLIDVAQIQKSYNDMNVILREITVTDPATVADPIRLAVTPVTADNTFLNYVFPLLMVLVLLFTGLLVSPILILTERKSPAAYRTFLLPVRDVKMLMSVFLTCLLVLAVQIIVMLVVASFFFTIWLSLPVLLAALLVLSTLFVLLGMLIGYALPREFPAIITSVLLATVLLVVSDFIVPLDVLPRYLSLFAGFNPVVIGGDIVRLALLFTGVGLVGNLVDILILLTYAVVVAIVVLYVYRHSKRHTLKSFVGSMLKSPRRRKKGF